VIGSRVPRCAGRIAACGAAALLAVPALTGSAKAAGGLPPISPQLFATADPTATPPQSKPDDVVTLGGNVFVTFQNGVGPDGGPSSTGVFQSTVVEYSHAGAVLQSWLLLGRCDGLGADTKNNRVFASVNEDNNSSLYVITPGVTTTSHYGYDPNPSQTSTGETSPNGGTDSISVSSAGVIYLAHSNPDPGFPSTAATYTVTLTGTTANLTPLFRVNSTARDAVSGQTVKLALTDPDSSTLIPTNDAVLPGRLLQGSQGDGVVVIVRRPGSDTQRLTRLVLKNAETPSLQPTVDDSAEVTGPGTLYLVDQNAGTVLTIDTANVVAGTLVVAQPSDSTTNPPTVGQLGVLDPTTGIITHFPNTFTSPKGLMFVPR
jgi:hypothetical protein